MRLLAACLLTSRLLSANDGSAEATPAGGIQLKREARISMEKERLTIAKDKVTVEYEFLNESSQDITTEVAFPVAPHGARAFLLSGEARGVGDFHVWVDGRTVAYETLAEALLNGKNVTQALQKLGIDAGSFGHFFDAFEGKGKSDWQRLSSTQQADAVQAGFFTEELPEWTRVLTYHWRQTFPAHRILRVRHEYVPANGLEHLQLDQLLGKEPTYNAKLSDFCIDPPLLKTMIAAVPHDNGFAEGLIEPEWVDYILTTANTWKTPIKDFELVIERPKPQGQDHYYISLCWDGKLEKRGPDTFVAKAKNFVPKHELRVMFVQIGK